MRNSPVAPFSTLVALVLIVHQAPTHARASDEVQLRTVRHAELRVTEGAIEPLLSGKLMITQPKVRAVLSDASARSVELRFRLLGTSMTTAPLSDGEAREQLGLKLLAQDGCNVVYVMWRIAPKSVLAVHVKHNPGQFLSSQCGAKGYRALSPQLALPQLELGVSHSLRADLEGSQLVVRVDGVVAWRGSVGEELDVLTGAVGLRTDNVRLEFELAAGGAAVELGARR